MSDNNNTQNKDKQTELNEIYSKVIDISNRSIWDIFKKPPKDKTEDEVGAKPNWLKKFFSSEKVKKFFTITTWDIMDCILILTGGIGIRLGAEPWDKLYKNNPRKLFLESLFVILVIASIIIVNILLSRK